jgi:hypothetical protein
LYKVVSDWVVNVMYEFFQTFFSNKIIVELKNQVSSLNTLNVTASHGPQDGSLIESTRLLTVAPTVAAVL